jgi:hypothetical protein
MIEQPGQERGDRTAEAGRLDRKVSLKDRDYRSARTRT